MPTLADIIAIVRDNHGDAAAAQLDTELRTRWPAQRIYIPPPETRKDPIRADQIRRAAKRLPAGVVADRYGVSRSWVYRVTKGD